MTGRSPTASTIRWCASWAESRGSCAAPAASRLRRSSLPAGFESAPELLALGGELKATFCLVKDGEAILSQHQGDLEDASTYDDYLKNLALYATLFDHAPVALVADRHPDYLSAKLARRARPRRAPAADRGAASPRPCRCVPRRERPIRSARRRCSASCSTVSASAMTARIWGGEFLLADYRGYRAARHVQAGRHAGGAPRCKRALAQSLCASDGGDGLGAFRHEFRRARAASLSLPPSRGRRSTP